MGSIKNSNYITIQGWMVTDLQLKGNELLVYAIIYGFSQDDGSVFSGSLQYLADWCNGTKQGIQKNLKSLIEKGYILKLEHFESGIKRCEYYCAGYETKFHSMKQSFPNNNSNTINSNISNLDKLDKQGKSPESFLGSVSKSPKKKDNLYTKCISEINIFTNDENVRKLLINYLNMRLEIKDKPLYSNQWKGMLTRLSKLADQYPVTEIVQQSLTRGYLSFYPIGSNNNLGFHDNIPGNITDNTIPIDIVDQKF